MNHVEGDGNVWGSWIYRVGEVLHIVHQIGVVKEGRRGERGRNNSQMEIGNILRKSQPQQLTFSAHSYRLCVAVKGIIQCEYLSGGNATFLY